MDSLVRTSDIRVTSVEPDINKVSLMIGQIPGIIKDPNPIMLGKNIVYICRDFNDPKSNWRNLTAVKLEGKTLCGCTSDPRIVKIAKQISERNITLKIGENIPASKAEENVSSLKERENTPPSEKGIAWKWGQDRN